MAEEPDQPPIEPSEPTQSPVAADSVPSNPTPPVEETPVQPTVPPSQPATVVVSKGSSHRLRNSLEALIVIVIAAVIALLISNHKSTTKVTNTATAKKDIPVLTYGVSNDGDVPQYPVNTVDSAFTVELNAQLYEGLVGYQSESKIVPLLATSWYNPDSSTWVFNLRHNVKFHTGRTMTADDVKYTLDYAVAHQNDDNGSSVLFMASTIKDVKVDNPYQVTVETNGPDPVLLSKLSLLGIVDSKAELGDYDAGTGPYVVKTGATPTKTTIDLAAAPNYWGGHIYTREVDVTVYNDIAQLTADAGKGKLDLSGDYTTSQINKIKVDHTLSIPDEGTSFLGLNTTKAGSPLQNVAVRQAIAEALDIPSILKASDLKGEQASQLVPLLLPGYNPKIADVSFNLDKAKQALAAANVGTKPLTFGYPISNQDQDTEIIKELTAAGLTIKAIPIDDFNNAITTSLAGGYDFYNFSYTSSFQDGQDILNGVLEGNANYSNPDIDSLLKQAGNTLDQSSRIKDMQKIATIVSTNKPVIPLYTVNRQYAVTKPYVIRSDMPGMVTGVYFWKVYQ